MAAIEVVATGAPPVPNEPLEFWFLESQASPRSMAPWISGLDSRRGAFSAGLEVSCWGTAGPAAPSVAVSPARKRVRAPFIVNLL